MAETRRSPLKEMGAWGPNKADDKTADQPGPAPSPRPTLDLAQAMRRIVPTPHGKLTMEKVFYLNTSRSRRMVLGLDIERDLQPVIYIDNSSGLGVRLSAPAVRSLLSEQWCEKVRTHMRSPCGPPGHSRVCEDADFRLTLIRDLEPGMKITVATDDSLRQFIVLGSVTCIRLLSLVPAILFHLELLEQSVGRAKEWMVATLDLVRNVAFRTMYEMKDARFGSERQTRELITNLGPKICKRDEEGLESISPSQLDFVIDLFYKYPETLARMVYDVSRESSEMD